MAIIKQNKQNVANTKQEYSNQYQNRYNALNQIKSAINGVQTNQPNQANNSQNSQNKGLGYSSIGASASRNNAIGGAPNNARRNITSGMTPNQSGMYNNVGGVSNYSAAPTAAKTQQQAKATGNNNTGNTNNTSKYVPKTFTNNTNSTNRDGYWVYNQNDGSYTYYKNNKGYTVMADDSLGRYDYAAQAYAEQNGGIGPTGTVNRPTGWENVKEMLSQSGTQAKDAINQGADAAINQLLAGKDDTNALYDNANRAAYLNMMNAEKNLAQQLAAAGLGKTGASETTRLANRSNYNALVNSNEGARDKAIRDIYNQIAGVKADTAEKLASLDSSQNTAMANAYMSLLANQQNQANLDREFQSNREQQRYQNAIDLANFGMGMGATGKTIYNNLNKVFPGFNTGDMNIYALGRLLQQMGYSDQAKALGYNV